MAFSSCLRFFYDERDIHGIGWPAVTGCDVKGDMVRLDKNTEQPDKQRHDAVDETTVQKQ